MVLRIGAGWPEDRPGGEDRPRIVGACEHPLRFGQLAILDLSRTVTIAVSLPSSTVPVPGLSDTGSRYRRCILPRPVTVFQTPVPGRVLIAFSVWRKPTTSGAAADRA